MDNGQTLSRILNPDKGYFFRESAIEIDITLNLQLLLLIITTPDLVMPPSISSDYFRLLLSLKEVKWGDDYLVIDDLVEKDDDGSENKRVIKTKQTSLSDFL